MLEIRIGKNAEEEIMNIAKSIKELSKQAVEVYLLEVNDLIHRKKFLKKSWESLRQYSIFMYMWWYDYSF